MKKILILILALVTVAITITTISGCKKEPITCDKPIDCLPPATQTAARTFGCLVDGEVFLPKEKAFRVPFSIAYQFFSGSYHFVLSATNVEKDPRRSVDIGMMNIELEENKTYLLGKREDNNSAFAEYFIGGGGVIYTTNADHVGALTITRFDPDSAIVSGTFWFEAINAAGEEVSITNGRFDSRYIK